MELCDQNIPPQRSSSALSVMSLHSLGNALGSSWPPPCGPGRKEKQTSACVHVPTPIGLPGMQEAWVKGTCHARMAEASTALSCPHPLQGTQCSACPQCCSAHPKSLSSKWMPMWGQSPWRDPLLDMGWVGWFPGELWGWHGGVLLVASSLAIAPSGRAGWLPGAVPEPGAGWQWATTSLCTLQLQLLHS